MIDLMFDYWDRIELAVFDVDGTLYHQNVVRRRMMFDLLFEAARTQSLETIEVLRFYRRQREYLADCEECNFEALLRDQVANRCKVARARLDNIIQEWLHTRPLRYIARSAVAGVDKAFRTIRCSGRKIGVLSDYPAEAKLRVLGLEADYIVSADMPQVGRMKPHPSGLLHVMELAGTAPAATLLVGDRQDRDGAAARRAGARWLMRGSKANSSGAECFGDFRQPPFDLIRPLTVSRCT